MKPFRDQGIQKKMHLMTLVICGAVLLVATVALFSFQVWNFRTNFQRDTVILSQIIASNSTAAVAFKQGDGATDILNALESDPAVISASIFTTGRPTVLLAHYGRAEDLKSRLEFPRDSGFVGWQLLVTKPIYNGDEGWVGTLYLRSDFRGTLLKQMKFYGQLIMVVLFISFCLGALLSGRLSRSITDPVRELAKTATIVGEKKDYSVRVAGERRGDEIGRLMDSFNDMLGRIQSQDAELSRSRQKMEALIHAIDGIVWERTPDDFKFTFISRQSETILGYAPQAWLDQPDFWAQKLHPQDAAKTVETGRELAARKQSYAYEYRMLAADGRIVWIRESGMVLVENGRPTALRGILQDITRQKLDAEQLDKLNRQLLDTSRQAGMADVATGVLHNVGNVLNSVSVATTVVGERLQRSKIINLQRATALMREQNGQLANYLTADPKGKLLPQYIDTVADQLAEERNELITKVQSVAQNIEHIKEIVAMQQSYAKVSGAFENLMPAELIEDALRINLAAFDRHQIQVVREITPGLPAICVDRHKVLQILINLLRNAKHAMEDFNQDRKEMVIAVGRCSEDMISIVVRDNGIGIPAANLTKIFNHGFTTKKDGHGFGLHSGANAAKEIGGSLSAASDGPGKGAEFTLKLPIAAATRKEDPAKN